MPEQPCTHDVIVIGTGGGTKLALPAAERGLRVALVERDDDRTPWTGNGVAEDIAIRGFHSTDMRLRDGDASAELLRFMGSRGATPPTPSTSRRFPASASRIRGPGRSTISLSPSRTAKASLKCARHCPTRATRSRR